LSRRDVARIGAAAFGAGIVVGAVLYGVGILFKVPT